MRKHRWKDNVCVHCGVQRETVNGRFVYYAYTHKTFDRPECREHAYKREEQTNNKKL